MFSKLNPWQIYPEGILTMFFAQFPLFITLQIQPIDTAYNSQ